MAKFGRIVAKTINCDYRSIHWHDFFHSSKIMPYCPCSTSHYQILYGTACGCTTCAILTHRVLKHTLQTFEGLIMPEVVKKVDDMITADR